MSLRKASLLVGPLIKPERHSEPHFRVGDRVRIVKQDAHQDQIALVGELIYLHLCCCHCFLTVRTCVAIVDPDWSGRVKVRMLGDHSFKSYVNNGLTTELKLIRKADLESPTHQRWNGMGSKTASVKEERPEQDDDADEDTRRDSKVHPTPES